MKYILKSKYLNIIEVKPHRRSIKFARKRYFLTFPYTYFFIKKYCECLDLHFAANLIPLNVKKYQFEDLIALPFNNICSAGKVCLGSYFPDTDEKAVQLFWNTQFTQVDSWPITMAYIDKLNLNSQHQLLKLWEDKKLPILLNYRQVQTHDW